MAAVAAEEVIVDGQVEALAHGGGFLSNREVRGAGVGVRDVLVLAELLDVVKHGLELANEHHVAIDAQAAGGRDCRIGLQLLAQRFAIDIDGNAAQVERFAASYEGGIDGKCFRHG